jgi:hypothetical protein
MARGENSPVLLLLSKMMILVGDGPFVRCCGVWKQEILLTAEQKDDGEH